MELQAVRVVEMVRGGKRVKRSIILTEDRIQEALRAGTENKRYALGDDTYRDVSKIVKDLVRVAYNQGYNAGKKHERISQDCNE